MQTIDRLDGDVHGGVEAERRPGMGYVAIDGLGYCDYAGSMVGECQGHLNTSISAREDQAVDFFLFQSLENFGEEFIAVSKRPPIIGGSEQGATSPFGTAYHLGRERHDPVVGSEARETVANPNDRVTKTGRSSDRAYDDCIEAWAVAARGCNS